MVQTDENGRRYTLDELGNPVSVDWRLPHEDGIRRDRFGNPVDDAARARPRRENGTFAPKE